MYYDPSKLHWSQQVLLKKKQAEIQYEELGQLINSVEDLYALLASIKQCDQTPQNMQMAIDTQRKIDQALQAALKTQIDIPASLCEFYKARDSNVIFDYLKHMQQDVLRQNEDQ